MRRRPRRRGDSSEIPVMASGTPIPTTRHRIAQHSPSRAVARRDTSQCSPSTRPLARPDHPPRWPVYRFQPGQTGQSAGGRSTRRPAQQWPQRFRARQRRKAPTAAAAAKLAPLARLATRQSRGCEQPPAVPAHGIRGLEAPIDLLRTPERGCRTATPYHGRNRMRSRVLLEASNTLPSNSRASLDHDTAGTDLDRFLPGGPDANAGRAAVFAFR